MWCVTTVTSSPELIEQINASGYGLTLGVHTRIDETIAQVTGSAHVGNLYVNRNMVGAVVGVQTVRRRRIVRHRAEAGGPLYLYRLLANRPESALAVTLARQDAEYPVDAQLKAALTPAAKCTAGNGRQTVQNYRRYVRNMASWRRQNTTIAARADG